MGETVSRTAVTGMRPTDQGPHVFPPLTISFLRGDTADPHCVQYPDRFYAQFTAPSARDPRAGKYEDGCSILVTPPTFDEYWGLAPRVLDAAEGSPGRPRRLRLRPDRA